MDSFCSQITRVSVCLDVFYGPRYFFCVMLLCESMQILEYLGCDGCVTVTLWTYNYQIVLEVVI